ncbi:neurofilament heavy polypeptide [Plutella xylostella]|uniref:neurofilament heavy polypeptide n=1 Tax=Plutella xylostella TaxID=51655 RepID=UPI0020321ADE|nr:neurofilament heavy polypeptide [Plutella xylostella]XP_048486163.1 neurofilament heavy polypeptide [Plutella xylostella]
MNKDLEELIEEADESDPDSLLLIKSSMEREQEDNKDFIEILISKLDYMTITWERPWYQKTGSVTRLPKADPDEEGSPEPFRKGIISTAEGEAIDNNWKKFVEMYDVPDQPKSFAKWRNSRGSSKSPNSPHEKVRHFVTAFLAQNLQRCLLQVFKYFIVTHAYSSKGPYTKLEEKVVMICYNFEPRTAAVTASYVLNRDPRTVYLKIEQFSKGKKEPRKPQKWTRERATMLVNKLIQYSGLSLKQLRDKTIDHQVWAKIDEEMNQGISNLKVFWHGKLHVQLFVDHSLRLSQIREDLLYKLEQKQDEYKTWRDIRWKELVKEFPRGCTAEFLYRIAERTFRKHKLHKLHLHRALVAKLTDPTHTRDQRLRRLTLNEKNELVKWDKEEDNEVSDTDDDEEGKENEENGNAGDNNDGNSLKSEPISDSPKKMKRRSVCENGSTELSPRKKDKKERGSDTDRPRQNSVEQNSDYNEESAVNSPRKKHKNHVEPASDCESRTSVSSPRKNYKEIKIRRSSEEERFKMFLASTDEESSASSPPKRDTERHNDDESAVTRSPTKKELKRRSDTEIDSTARSPGKNKLKPPPNREHEPTINNTSREKQVNEIESTSARDYETTWMVRLDTPTIENLKSEEESVTSSQKKSEEESVASSQKKKKSKRRHESENEPTTTANTPAKVNNHMEDYSDSKDKSLTHSSSKKKSKQRVDSENESGATVVRKKENHKRLLEFEFDSCIPETITQKDKEGQSERENEVVTKRKKLKRRHDSENDSAAHTPRKMERSKIDRLLGYENESHPELMSQNEIEPQSGCENGSPERNPRKKGKKKKKHHDSENDSAAHTPSEKELNKINRLLGYENESGTMSQNEIEPQSERENGSSERSPRKKGKKKKKRRSVCEDQE